MLIFPASYTEVDTRNREPDSSSTEEKTTTVSGQKEETKVKSSDSHWSMQPQYIINCQALVQDPIPGLQQYPSPDPQVLT